MLEFQRLSAVYQETLLGVIAPFWLRHSADQTCGGYFNVLTNTGEAIDADKTIALQAQQVWAFATLYKQVDAKATYLEHALHGTNFLSNYAHDHKLNCYSVVDRRGRPVAPAADVLPDCAVAQAYVRVFEATANDEWAMLAKQTLQNLLRRRLAVRTKKAQDLGGFRQWQHLSEPVAVLKVLLDTKELLSEESWKEAIGDVLHELLHEFTDRRADLLREYVLPEGSFSNTPQGRRLSPGLTFQAVGCLLDLAHLTNNRKLSMQAVAWSLRLAEWAWDAALGGFVQWVDMKDQPVLEPTVNHRMAWIHLEALAAFIKGYLYTHHPECPKWFKRVHDYTFASFADPANQGWYPAVDAKGQPVLPAKATPTEGCYHLVKCLYETWQTLDQCALLQPASRYARTYR
ncbi:AGE family epimerase/isomerase [Nibrella saemangeumensis]|uniref:AGE family epimerase/isomerase n=1 Tax=Nibrella saemangeumensis TaxID=1084526 RepID=A0ABP8MBB5_9BACT